MVAQHSVLWKEHNLFNRSPTDGHLYCSHFFSSDMFDKENHILVYSSLCARLINSLRLIPRSEISRTKDLHDQHFWSCMTQQGISLVAQMVKRLSTMWETWVQSLGREDSLEKEMATHTSTLAWKMTQQSLDAQDLISMSVLPFASEGILGKLFNLSGIQFPHL